MPTESIYFGQSEYDRIAEEDNKSAFVREAVREKMEREQDEEVAD